MTSYKIQLARHLGFIERSCEAFDRGFRDESLRIAVSLRVMFHHTKSSTSLLTHLKVSDSVRVLSTFEPGVVEHPDGTMSVWIPMFTDSRRGQYVPLGNTKRKELIPAPQWWTEIIMGGNNRISRRDVVLSTANQDGGAHVDAKPNAKMQELLAGVGTLTWSKGDKVIGKVVLDNHHLILLRQLGYEVLNSPDIVALSK